MDIPPLFKPGTSVHLRAFFFVGIAIAMLFIDLHAHVLTQLRQVISATLYPLQVVLLIPHNTIKKFSTYFTTLTKLQKENDDLHRQQIRYSQLLQQERYISAENTQLRYLLNMQKRIQTPSLIGEILYDAHNPFTRKIILNRGSRSGVMIGQPVIDNIGIVGQVTRTFLWTSEVTLITDKDQAIPVQVLRNGLRSVIYGRGQFSGLDLRFITANADIQIGDVLVTSGIDNLYPPGLSVATVLEITHQPSEIFVRVMCAPSAGIDCNKQLLILLVK